MLHYSLGSTPNLGPGLYNGNIRSMYTVISDDNADAFSTHQTNYTYDQLNRITSMTGYNAMSGASLSGYSSSYSYDANGNLQTLTRYAAGKTTPMDNFVYKYEESINDGKNNQLSWVEDLAGASLFGDIDIDNSMSAGNYQYDAIGRLLKDDDEDISSIEWTVTNKVKQINYTDGRQIRFDYDPLGNRVGKHATEGAVTTSTYYVLDAQGNAMSMYHFDNAENNVYLRERNIYGSSRLGQEQLNMQMSTSIYQYNGLLSNEAGDKRYELSNHLGNVLQVVSDSKLPGGAGAYYTADVKSWSDYYPFGMQLPGRNGSEEEYRYGFNGMERDDELKGSGNSYDFRARMFDPRIGRWLSRDGVEAQKPNLSPYQGLRNNPIAFKTQSSICEV